MTNQAITLESKQCHDNKKFPLDLKGQEWYIIYTYQ